MTKTSEDRLACIVPGCRRTHPPIVDEVLGQMTEWVCGRHWRATSARYRAIYARVKRELRSGIRSGCDQAWALGRFELRRRVWRKLRKQAVERGVGI